MSDVRFERLNALAGVFAILLFAALGVAWWRDRAQTYATPRWDTARFVALTPAFARAAGAPDSSAAPGSAASPASRELWVVAVNLQCPHCQQHLRALSRRTATRAHPPVLAALVVDAASRPDSLALGVALAGGTWWDRDQVWRQSWGRRVYGETFRFDRTGRLLSSTPVGVVPDSSGSRM